IDDTYLHLSFDDGFRNNVENAAPILCELEIPAVFFVTTDYMSSGWEGAREFARRSGRDGVVEMATWEQLRQLDARGFEIGAHTCTHRRLADLHRAEARSEILESKRAIEDEIDGECRYFSWPFGGRDDIRPEVIELVKSVGFEGCFSGCRGEVEPGSTDPFRIPRHHIQPHWPVSHVRYFAFRPPAGSVDGFA
ncbi:MAG: polysaccharide deacetylase family protein, partial [Bradymonadaceae bacterium]